MHGFKLEASEAMDVVDKLTALDVKAATTAGDIAQGLSQFANIAKLGGVSVDQAAAYVATIADVNQMSGITVGQSLKTIMSRYGNVKAGAYNKLNIDSESTDTTEKLNDVERVLNKMGISIRKTNLEFKDFDEVLNEIAEKWGTLDNVSKRAISNAFAGVRQQEAFMILLENYDKYKDLLEVSENSQGTAERKYQSYKDSYAFSKNELTAALEQVANSSELSKLLTDLTKIGTGIVEALQKIYPFLPGIVSNFMMYRTVQGKGLLNTGYNLLHRGIGNGIGGVAGGASGYGFGATPIGRTVRGLWERVGQKFSTGRFRDIDVNAEIQKINNREALPGSRLNKKKAKIIAEEMSGNHFTVVESVDPYTGKSRKYTMYGTHKTNERIKELDEKTEKKRQRVEEIAKKQKDRDEEIKQKQEKKYRDQQLKYVKQGYQYAQKEVRLKQQLLTPAQQEVLSKNAVLSDATKEKLVEKGILQDKKQGLTYEQAIALLNSDILSDENLKKEIENDIYNIDLQRKTVEGEISEEAAKKNVENVGGARKTIGNINASPQALKANKWRAGLSYVEMGANLVMTSLSQLSTAATTHTYENETVESSKEAQKKGAGVSAALSLIPIVGSFIGPLAGEAVAAAVDKERDKANYSTKTANENLNKLESLTSSFDQLGGTEAGSAERHKLVQEFKKDIFDADNADLRKQLQRHLGKTNISSLLEKIDGNTASATESLEALKKLQVAQIQAEKAQIFNKYASTMYDDNRELNETISKIEGYSGIEGSTVRDAFGITVGGAAAGAGAGALSGLAIGAAAGSGGGPVGAAIGALVGLGAGLIGGIVGANAYAEGDIAGNKANNNNLDKITSWRAMNSIERADVTREALEEAQKSIIEIESSQDEVRQKFIETYLKRNEQDRFSRQFTVDDAIEAYEKYKKGVYGGYGIYDLNTTEETNAAKDLKNSEEQLEQLSTLVSEYNNMITILERQTSVEMQILGEMNDLTLQEALINAKDRDKYITEMSIAELKHVGIDEILTSYANAIKDSGGLKGIGIWADAGQTKLSEAGYEYLFEQLKKQGDEEINAVLRGEAYTLQEAIDLRETFGPESFQVKKLLESFSSAFDLVADDIKDGTDKLDETLNKYGLLTLADGMASTSELVEKVGSFTDLMNSITNGAGETSAWMEKIISQFPQLIKYMGNTSELFSQSIKYLDQLSEQYINAQTDELLESSAYYSSIEKDLYDKLGDSEAANSLRASKASTLSGVMTWIQTQYVNGELTAEAEEVLAKLVEVTEEAGTKIVSKIDKAFYDQLIEYKTKTIDYILENLNSQKEALQAINSEREYENKLIEARLKLEDASKQKKRVYRAGVGWVYESDQSAIESAQENLKSLETEKQISKLDVQIATLEGVKAEINGVYDKENYETLKKLYDEAVDRGKVENSMNGFLSTIKDSVNGIVKKLSTKIEKDVVPEAEEAKKVDMTEAKEAWDALLKATPGTEGYNTAVNNFHTAMAKAQANGATEEDVKDWQTYNKTGARIKKETTAWQVYKGAVEKQTEKVKHTFNVAADKNDSNKRFIGFTNGDELTDTQVQTWLLDGIKSGNALAWAMTDDGLIGPISVGSDVRFKYQEDKSLSDYFTRITTSFPSLGKQILISDPGGENEAVMYDNGDLLKVTNTGNKDLNGLLASAATDVGSTDQFYKAWEGDIPPAVWDEIKEEYGKGYNYIPTADLNKIAKSKVKANGYAEGTLSLINEEGTEAIITPQGTLTALPSGTGIIPADITKNLWELGEVAPALLRVLGDKLPNGLLGTSILDRIVNDESFNISNLTMNVDADGSFDVDKFINSIKSRVALTKNSSK